MTYHPVLWGEGMLLTPQHLQQRDRYFEHALRRRLRSVESLDYGFCTLELDPEALAEGRIGVREATGVLPDGMWFDLPREDELPAARGIEEHFNAGVDRLGVYLAIAKWTPGQLSAQLAPAEEGKPGPLTPFKGEPAKIRDELDLSREDELMVARKRLKLLFEGEDLSPYVTLKVAELQRTAAGAFELSKQYIPPCLYVSASQSLVAVLQRTLGILGKRSEDLSGQRRQRSQGLAEFTMSEAGNFWFLHTINGHIPGLAHLFRHARVHPERAYRELAALAGELYTFASEGHPRDIPPYDHEDLGGTFARLVAQLRTLLGTVLTTRVAPIPLEMVRPSVYMAKLHDDRAISGRLVVSVKADVPEEKLVAELPVKGKVASADRLDDLIVKALPGLPIAHLAAPPSEVSPQPGRVYFHLAQQGEQWDAIVASRTLSFYVPAEFANVSIEMMAVA